MFRNIAVPDPNYLTIQKADKLVENVIGVASIPTQSILISVNGRDIRLPIVVYSDCDSQSLHRLAQLPVVPQTIVVSRSEMIGQIQLIGPPDATLPEAVDSVGWVDLANALIPSQVARGGGVRSTWIRRLRPGHAVLDFLVDVGDAMGANMVNKVAEGLAPIVTSQLPAGWRTHVRILSNDGQYRLVTVETPVNESMVSLDGLERRIERAVHQLMVGFASDWRASDVAINAYLNQTPSAISVRSDKDDTAVLVVTFPVIIGTVGRALQFPFSASKIRRLNPKNAMELGGWVAAAAVRIASSGFTESIDWVGPDDMVGDGEGGVPLPSLRFMSVPQRRETIGLRADMALIPSNQVAAISQNVQLPVGVLPNLRVNNRFMHFPYMVEEPSIGAAIGAAAKRSRVQASARLIDGRWVLAIQANVSMADGVDLYLDAAAFAELDARRAITNNKGIFNGIDPVLLALGVDPTAIGHSLRHASFQQGRVMPMVKWQRSECGVLGELNAAVPACHIQPVQGLETHFLWGPLGIGGIEDALMGAFSAGVLANWSAINALATRGINAGHMPLHDRVH